MTNQNRKQSMSNKQVIAIFIMGVGLLLGAFWAGLYVVKQSNDADTSQSSAPVHSTQAATPVRQQSTTPAAAATESSGQYVVLVASFGTLEKAKQLEADLQKQNYRSAHVQLPSEQETLYRVNIGPYDKSDAEKVATHLSNERRGIMINPWKPNP